MESKKYDNIPMINWLLIWSEFEVDGRKTEECIESIKLDFHSMTSNFIKQHLTYGGNIVCIIFYESTLLNFVCPCLTKLWLQGGW